MPTTEPIQIPIEGEATDFIADAKKIQSEMDTLSAKLKEAGVSQSAYNKAVQEANKQAAAQAKATAQAAAAQDKLQKEAEQAAAAQAKNSQTSKAASISITDLRSAYMIAADAARIAGQVWQATGQEFVNYAEQVKNMSRSLGASAEETSRLIQVADDVRISYDSLNVAMKMAQKDGITPNIEGLAKLSDQYLSLAPGVERTKFLLDKFGKSGLEMGKLMEKGGDGIRKASKAVSENLIMTEKGIEKSDKYQAKLDDLSDSWTGLSVALGDVAIEPVTNALENLNTILVDTEDFVKNAASGIEDFTQKNETAGRFLDAVWQTLKDMNPVLHLFDDNSKDAASSTQDFSGALGDNSGALADNKDAIKEAEKNLSDYKDMLKQVSQANQDAESFIQSYADFQKGYDEDHKKALEDLTAAQQDYFTALYEHGKGSEEVDKATEALHTQQAEVQKLEATWHESTNKMIYDMVMAKVSVDGLTDAEFKATQQLAVTMGIRTQAEADQANQMMDTANTLADGIAMQEDVQREKANQDAELLRLENEKAAAAGETTTAIVDGSAQSVAALGGVAQAVDSATQSYIAMAKAAWDASAATNSMSGASSSSSSSGENVIHSRDTGGPGVAGVPYMIGRGAQPEMFIPKTDGTFVPNADKKMGNNITINVTNPKQETSEASIMRQMKKLSYLGMPV